MNSGICFYSVSVYLGLYLGQISYFEKLSNGLLYCFHRLERRSPGSRKQYGLVIDGASLSLVFKGPYTGKSIVFVWMNSHISSSRMAAFKEARYRTRLCTYRNIIYTWALSICQNWPAGPLPDQSVWKWKRLFPRVFAEKPSPSCVLFRNWLTWLESFD